MAIIIRTRNPHQLVDRIKQYINSQIIRTWEYDRDGDFTAAPAQWKYKAWMRPLYPDDGNLVFGIISSKNFRMTKELYGVYHGRFVATLLSHFDTDMDDLEVTPMLDNRYDSVGQQWRY